MNMRRKILIVAAALLLTAGLARSGEAMMVPAKAWLAGQLIDHAWVQTMKGDADARPWPWMDSAPVAKLTVPRLNKSFVVMRGTSGAVLAFAPGWNDGTDAPNQPGISLISGHRDTHFGFLRKLKAGDAIILETPGAGAVTYTVEQATILQQPEMQVSRQDSDRVLLLSTCFPFTNWRPGGDMRFVVEARVLPGADGATS